MPEQPGFPTGAGASTASLAPPPTPGPILPRHVAHPSDPFPLLIFLVALGAVTCGHWLATHLAEAVSPRLGHWLVPTALAVACGSAFWLRRLHHRDPRPRRHRDAALQFLLIWVVFASGIGFAVALEHWWLEGPPELEEHPTIFLTLAIAGVVGFSFWQSRLVPGFSRPRSLRPVLAKALPRKERFRALILCVSTPNQSQLVAPSDSLPPGTHAQVMFAGGEGTAHLMGKSAAEDIGEIQRAAQAAHKEAKKRAQTEGKPPPRQVPYWNWQQLLRAIEHHPDLDHVWLIGSPGAAGSFAQREDCRRFLQPYLRKDGHVHCCPTAVDFEDLDALVVAIRSLLATELRSTPAARTGVDITGGQKVASIAGAALTMNQELRFQYVQTNAPYDAITYGLYLDNPPSPHGHT